MAKKGVIAKDNMTTWRFGGRTYALEASLGTGTTYANEFAGTLEAPYNGLLAHDLFVAYKVAQQTVTESVLADESGRPVLSEDGGYVPDEGGVEVTHDNPDYRGFDVEALLRLAWAMARSVDPECAKPYAGGYEEFREEIIHKPASMYDEARLYKAVVLDLGTEVIFRDSERPEGAGEPDEAQA